MSLISLAVFSLISLHSEGYTNKEDFNVYTNDGLSAYLRKLSISENAKLQRECGINQMKSGNKVKRLMINNGAFAVRSHIPWAASFLRSKGSKNSCGATLISSRHLLTAAHCFFHYDSAYLPCEGPHVIKDIDQMRIAIGGVCLDKNSKNGCSMIDVKLHSVKGFAIASNFNKLKCVGGHDIAVIELTNDLIFNEYVKPACLPPKSISKNNLSHIIETFTDVYSFGFGMNQNGETSHLIYFNSHFHNSNTSFIKNDLIDAVSDENGNQTKSRICPGDSGAGLMAKSKSTNRYHILGIHSYSLDCEENDPDDSRIYSSTFVGFHLDEICNLIGVCGR